MKREEDPGIAWIREIRHQISAECDHDTKKFGDHLRELEKKYADRLEPMTKSHYTEANEQVLSK